VRSVRTTRSFRHRSWLAIILAIWPNSNSSQCRRSWSQHCALQ
jgi:hypothetical protein